MIISIPLTCSRRAFFFFTALLHLVVKTPGLSPTPTVLLLHWPCLWSLKVPSLFPPVILGTCLSSDPAMPGYVWLLAALNTVWSCADPSSIHFSCGKQHYHEGQVCNTPPQLQTFPSSLSRWVICITSSTTHTHQRGSTNPINYQLVALTYTPPACPVQFHWPNRGVLLSPWRKLPSPKLSFLTLSKAVLGWKGRWSCLYLSFCPLTWTMWASKCHANFTVQTKGKNHELCILALSHCLLAMRQAVTSAPDQTPVLWNNFYDLLGYQDLQCDWWQFRTTSATSAKIPSHRKALQSIHLWMIWFPSTKKKKPELIWNKV